jgi:hypothetical protein
MSLAANGAHRRRSARAIGHLRRCNLTCCESFNRSVRARIKRTLRFRWKRSRDLRGALFARCSARCACSSRAACSSVRIYPGRAIGSTGNARSGSYPTKPPNGGPWRAPWAVACTDPGGPEKRPCGAATHRSVRVPINVSRHAANPPNHSALCRLSQATNLHPHPSLRERGGAIPPPPLPNPRRMLPRCEPRLLRASNAKRGADPPRPPRFTASRAIARPLRSGALRRRATGRGARPPNPCKPLGRLPRIDRHRPRSNGHGLQLQHVSSNVERTNARTGDFAPNSSASRNWTRRDVRSRRNCPRSRSRNRRARAAPSCRERGAPRCPTAARSRERCVARP